MRESEVAQSCPNLSEPMDYSLSDSSIHGIFQARVLEWGAIAFSVVKGEVEQSRTELPRFQSQFCWTLGKPHIVIQISLLSICKILGKSFNLFFLQWIFLCQCIYISHYLLLLYIIVFNYIYNGIIFSHKQEWNFTIWGSINVPGEY